MRLTHVALCAAALVLTLSGCGSKDSGQTASSGGGAPGGSGASSSASVSTSGSTSVSTAASTSGGSAEPCSLVTSDEAAAALGTPVKTTYSNVDSGVALVCEYTGDDGFHQLTVSVADGEQNSSQFGLLGHDATAVDGVGSAAYWNDSMATLFVLAGSTEVSLDVADSSGKTSPADLEAIAIPLAKQAVSRL